MFNRLQQKWKVGGTRLLLILCTFAIGGSLTGYAARWLMLQTGMSRGAGWIVLYILLLTLLWPLAVLLVSLLTGQFPFFRNYLRKMGKRMRLVKPSPVRIAIFASGAGSNAAKIIGYFQENASAEVAIVVCNKPGAGVLAIAERAGIPTLLIDKEVFFRGGSYVTELRAAGIDFIVLAGFLWKIPAPLVQAFPRRIVNIHPALLPNYGGKGMYGSFVHEAVIAAREPESGITIHWVDEQYDNGDIIFQARVPVTRDDTAETLADKIHVLEHRHYPEEIAKLVEANH